MEREEGRRRDGKIKREGEVRGEITRNRMRLNR